MVRGMATLRSDPRWVLAVTAPQREKWASENVKRQGHEFYLPMCKERLIRGGKIQDRERPFFPRYLFVRVSVQWRFLTGTFGVIGIVFDGETPGVVPDKYVDELKASADENGIINLIPPDEPETPLPKKGTQVQISAGAFNGIAGVFMGKSGDDRVKIMLSMFGRAVPVEVRRNEFVVG